MQRIRRRPHGGFGGCGALGLAKHHAVPGVMLAEKTSEMRDQCDGSPTSNSVHLTQKGAWIGEGYCFIPGAKLDQEFGKLSCLTQSTPFLCCTPTVSRYVCSGWSGCPLLLAAECCGFICRTRASAEVDHEPVIPCPQPWEEREMFSPTNTWVFFQIVATQREEKQRDAPYELGSLQMLS